MALKMVKYGTCTVWRTKVVIKDKNGIPDFMTLFFMDPRDGKPDEKDVPDMFKVNGKIVQGVAISQFHNTEIKGVPHSLPYNMPIENKTFTQAEKETQIRRYRTWEEGKTDTARVNRRL